MKEIKTIKTTKGELQYYRDWGNDGFIRMLNPQTINRYHQIKNRHPNFDDYDAFIAFGESQFDAGYKKLIDKGAINEGDKVCRSSLSGLFGTKQGIRNLLGFYDAQSKLIAQECDPQEIYFYEYNNHECCYSYEGDREVFELMVDYFGEEVANTIKRI